MKQIFSTWPLVLWLSWFGVILSAPIPSGSLLLVSRIEHAKVKPWKGHDVPSRGHFWPASTLKPWACYSALMWGRMQGVAPRDTLRFWDASGAFRGSILGLCRGALVRGENVPYDRLMRIAGRDFVNQLARNEGLAHTWISQAYGRGNLAKSPALWRRQKSGKWERVRGPVRSTVRNRLCRTNCTSLLDLQKMLWIAAWQDPIVRGLLAQTKTVLGEVFKGKGWKVWGKDGWVANHHILTNAIVSDGSRFWAVSVGMRASGNFAKDRKRLLIFARGRVRALR